MPRPATGTVQWVPARDEQPGHYRVRITCADGSRPWIDLDPSPRSPQGEKRARERAGFYTERARREGIGALPQRRTKASVARAAASPTFAEYALAWTDDRRARGIANADKDYGTIEKHFVPTFGSKRMTEIVRDDVKAIVAELDAKVQERSRFMATADPRARGKRPGIAAKSAINYFDVLTKLFDDSCNSKTPNLVVLRPGANPAANVRGPDPAPRPQKHYLFPSEFLRFATCEMVPLEFRQVVTSNIYFYTRPSELRDAHVRDADIEHWTMRIHETIAEDGRRKTTKGKRSRLVPIEPALRPLITRLAAAAPERDGFLAPRWDYSRESQLLRHYLLVAGVDRAELHERRLSSSPIRFHSLRDTGITWAAIRGDDPLRIQQRAGHRNFKTTAGYIAEAENLSAADFGTPFPELPACLLGESRPMDQPSGRSTPPNGSRRGSNEPRSNGRGTNEAVYTVSSHESSQDSQPRETASARIGGHPASVQLQGRTAQHRRVLVDGGRLAKSRGTSARVRYAPRAMSRQDEAAPAAPQPEAASDPGPAAPTATDPYRIELPSFEGPLDLLLHLIQEHELDIMDIPIGFVTQKYLEYVTLMQEINIDVASEYLVMAATLAHIKSRMLLPIPPEQQLEQGEEEIDPRAELVRRLLEYQKYKLAAEHLGSRDVLGRDVFGRGTAEPELEGPAPLAQVGLFRLLDAFQAVLDRAKTLIDHEIDFERFSITDRILQLADVLSAHKRLKFEDLFEGTHSRSELIVTFLALLEMTRLRMTRLIQSEPLEPIFVELAVADEDIADLAGAAVAALSAPLDEPTATAELDGPIETEPHDTKSE